MKKAFFMLNKLRTDLKRARMDGYELAEDVISENLGYYYFIFRENRIVKGKDQALINKFDENGIPINKTYIDVKDKEYVYFPISIGQVGLSVFHSFLESEYNNDRQRFLKFVDWFYDHAEISESLGARWMTDVSLPSYKNPGPWQSAFSQSRGISILLRGYQLTGDQKYFELAEKALIPYTLPVGKGGVTSYTEWGPFYEEYTAKVPTLVLNGMIFALCGVHEFMRVKPDQPMARKIFEEGIQTLRNILPVFDMGFWSRYNLCKVDWYPRIDPATILYQKLHVTQLQLMYKITGDPIFKRYAEHFDDQLNIWNAFRMYLVKFKALRKMGRL